MGVGYRGGRGAESYNCKKAWSSINCLILFDSGKAIMSTPLELRVECGLSGGLVGGGGGGGGWDWTKKIKEENT